MPAPCFDRSEILRGLQVYHRLGDTFEIRIVEGEKASGYFTDFNKAADAVIGRAGDYAIYVTINPTDPRLIARANNHLKSRPKSTTSDDDIARLNWLPADCDPPRPTGISSTDEEHAISIKKCKEINRWLIDGQGWPEKAFVIVDSGNGGYLLARIELDNTEENRKLVANCLETLDYLFTDETFHVDTTSGNPARILRVPGTLNAKGDEVGDLNMRHRMARIIEAPDTFDIVPKKLLAVLASMLPKLEELPKRGFNNKAFDPVEYCKTHNLSVHHVKSFKGGTAAVLEQCVFNPDHHLSAVIIGWPNGARTYRCRHKSCLSKHWKEAKEIIQPGEVKEAAPISNSLQTIEPSINPWIEEYHFKTAVDTEKLYHYAHGVYLDDGEAVAKALIETEFSMITNNKIVADVIGKIKRRTFIDPCEFNKEKIINLKNGLLEIETLELRPHSPEVLSTSQLDVIYDPEAKAPRIQQFLKEVAQSGDIALIQEVIGWLLWPDYHIHKAVMMLGPGRNGKGTLLRLITTFLGAKNIANRAIQELVTDRFAKADLFGKLANLGGDLPDKDLSDTAAFKGLTGGDRQSAQNKYMHAFNFTNKAKLIFSAQKPPKSSDDSFAFYSRWILIEFKNIFDVQRGTGDPDLDSKLSTPEELSGLLNIALDGLARLRSNKWQFSYKLTVEDVELMYKRMANPVLAFLIDECIEDESNYIEKNIFYKRFKDYSKQHGLKPMSLSKFGKDLKDQSEIPITDYRPHDPTGRQALPRCWLGARFKEFVQSELEVASIPSILFPYPTYPIEWVKYRQNVEREEKRGENRVSETMDDMDAAKSVQDNPDNSNDNSTPTIGLHPRQDEPTPEKSKLTVVRFLEDRLDFGFEEDDIVAFRGCLLAGQTIVQAISCGQCPGALEDIDPPPCGVECYYRSKLASA